MNSFGNTDQTFIKEKKNKTGLLESIFSYSFQDYLNDRSIKLINNISGIDDISYKQQINHLIEQYCDEWPNM